MHERREETALLFNSVFFITVFFPIMIIGWYALNRWVGEKWAKLFLLAMSLWFYGYFNLSYLAILVCSILFNYWWGRLFLIFNDSSRRKIIEGIGVSANLLLIFYFKYFNFFIDNCNAVLHTSIAVDKIVLPLGISFFVFQQVSYIIDLCRGDITQESFLDYACYVSFFPQLIAGPIVLFDEMLPQLKSDSLGKLKSENLLRGFYLFTLGFAKKVLLADNLAVLVDAEFGNIAYLDAIGAWATVLFYAFQLYFDFSGYCDMARGLATMLGFELPENFDSPYKAVSIRDLWRRWHITLGRFFTRYVYIPLGGSRKGKVRYRINLAIVFLLSGLWHGANWTFVLWGLLQAIAIVFDSFVDTSKYLPKWVCRSITFVYFMITLAVFRADSIAQGFALWSKMFAGGINGSLLGICCTLNPPELFVVIKAVTAAAPSLLVYVYVAIYLILLTISVVLTLGHRNDVWIERNLETAKGRVAVAFLFLWSFVSLSQVSTFLYFNF